MTTKSPAEEFLPTRSSLLRRLKDLDDDQSWRLFDEIYRKMLHGFARRAGLGAAASEEVVQEVMIAAAKTMPGFDYRPQQCSFKGWLLKLARCRIADQIRKQNRRALKEGINDASCHDRDMLENLPDPKTLLPDEEWEREWQQSLLDAALERVKSIASPKQFQIFHLYVVKQWPPAVVARTLSVSRATVYLAKLRIGALVKKEVRALKAQWGKNEPAQ